MTSLIGVVAWLLHTSPFLNLLVGVEVARAVMEKRPVDYPSVNDPITSESPVVVGQNERAPIAVNQLDCTAY